MQTNYVIEDLRLTPAITHYQSINQLYLVSKTSSQPGGRLIDDTPNKITNELT